MAGTLLMAVALLVIGCGGGGGTSSKGSSGESTTQATVAVNSGSLTKKQFIKQADRICEEGRHEFEDKLEALLKNLGQSGQSGLDVLNTLEASHEEALVNQFFIPIHKKELDRISALGVPSGDEADVTSILSAIQNGLDEAKNRPSEFTHTRLINFPGFSEAAKLATVYGFTECGLT